MLCFFVILLVGINDLVEVTSWSEIEGRYVLGDYEFIFEIL